jgi:formate hydrogenlyase transcriptional activator
MADCEDGERIGAVHAGCLSYTRGRDQSVSSQSILDAGAVGSEADDIAALRSIVQGVARSTGDDFLRTLVRHLAHVVGTRHAFVAEFVPPQKIRTIAFWSNGGIVDNIEYELPGTPCEEVINGGFCHIPSGVQQKYPATEKGIEGYLGVPLTSHDGTVLGHLCVFDEDPLPPEPRKLYIFEIFAARASAELDRLRVEQQLRASEDELKDLFEEAPIAYVHEGLDTRFIHANQTALKTLGVRPDEVCTMYGRTLIPDTPEAQQRLRQALASIEAGTQASGVVLELRRKDNGRPLWIQWWSRPHPSGTYTRTMFVDITEQVLLEQERARLSAQNVYLREEIKSVHNFEEIVGASSGLMCVLEHVQRVAPTNATVLILGESGTGKELIARAIHSSSGRAEKPFIKINCAALPPGLVESELFGHERGAFSGAIQRRIGRFELASGGTIFLDEIGEVPADVQVKLLRVLQEREFERVGGGQTIKADVRVIAATNRDLHQALRDGAFRPDLFYRLNVFPITLPPLRERADDIPLLVRFFVGKYGPLVGRRPGAIDAKTMERLVAYQWPGNIRELENIIERALILTTSDVLSIGPEILPTTAPRPVQVTASVVGRSESEGDLDTVQRQHIVSTLREANWVVEGERGAARRLGLKPATLRHRMKKLGISRPGAEPA